MSITFPPTPRDFNIHHLCLVQLQSTRRVAEIHHLSQTRVRQIVARVSQWLSATLPIKTDLEKEQQAQLAQHIAADQMRHQLEALQNIFEGSGDPKYLRHQTRIIAALARLGIVPGTIEALAADATVGPYDPTEPQAPWSEDEPVSAPRSGPGYSRSGSDPRCCPPPPGDCSPSSNHAPAGAVACAESPAASPHSATTSDATRYLNETDLRGLNLIEKRLLILIENTPPIETDRLASLNNTLDEIRTSKAALQLRLAPHIPGAELQLNPDSPIQTHEQEQTELTETRS